MTASYKKDFSSDQQQNQNTNAQNMTKVSTSKVVDG